MSVLFLSSDLFFGSRVAAAAQRLGLELRNCSTADAAAVHCDEPTRVVIIDLTLPGLDIHSAVAGLPEPPGRPYIVAFGPHVQGAVLAAARDAGCDEVHSRGHFDAQLDELLQRWCGPS